MKLHGFPISNYYNIVKLALIEKGLPFEEVLTQPKREDGFLKISPAGKIPVLECQEGFLSETRAILQYLEVKHPQPSLIGTSPFTAGLADQIYCLIHFNLDAVVRPFFKAAFFGGSASEADLQKMNDEVAFGAAALTRVARFDPYMAGAELTIADLAAVNTLPLVSLATSKLGQPDPLSSLKGWPEYIAAIKGRPAVQRVLAESAKAVEAFMAKT